LRGEPKKRLVESEGSAGKAKGHILQFNNLAMRFIEACSVAWEDKQ